MRVASKTVFAFADQFLSPLHGPRILIYHQVGTRLGREMEVSKELFGRQLDWLQAVGVTMDLESALPHDKHSISNGVFVVTFDDGYADVYDNAFPILLEHGIPFVIYLNTHPVETRIPLAPGAEPLNWDQIEEMMASNLLTIGAHTHRHADLDALGLGAVSEELDICNSVIQRRLGVVPRHFAYPWGSWSSSAEPLVRERYETAALAHVASIERGTNTYRLPRIPIQRSDGLLFFRQKLNTGLRVEDWARRRLRGHGSPSERSTDSHALENEGT